MPQYDFGYPLALSAAKGLTVCIKSFAKRLQDPMPQYDFLYPFALSAAKGLKVCIKPFAALRANGLLLCKPEKNTRIANHEPAPS